MEGKDGITMSVTSTCVNAKIEGKKVVFFGAGADGSRALSALRSRQTMLVSYICDNDPDKHEKTLWGVPICHPEKLLLENKSETIIIITSAKYYREIAKWLFDR